MDKNIEKKIEQMAIFLAKDIHSERQDLDELLKIKDAWNKSYEKNKKRSFTEGQIEAYKFVLKKFLLE